MKSKTNIKSFLLILSILISTIPLTLNAQGRLNCRVVESVGNANSIKILNQINSEIEGTVYKISPRKKLILKKVRKVHFDGCKIIVDVEAKLKRKIRRDAKGTIRISAIIDSFNRDRVCVKKAKVDKIKLSNTLRIGEKFYKWVANKVLPNNHCFNIR